MEEYCFIYWFPSMRLIHVHTFLRLFPCGHIGVGRLVHGNTADRLILVGNIVGRE